MKKVITILMAIVIGIIISESAWAYALDEPQFSYEDLYAQAFRVCAVERDENDIDLVSVEDCNGMVFQFIAEGSDWCVGDGCACIMAMNGTPEVFDDSILSARYFIWE